jgi:hypothetical protein
MAHFAKISDTSQVLGVHVVNNSDVLNADGVEDETVGQAYLEQHNNWPANLWIQTSYNTIGNVHSEGGTAFRGNYAGMGYIWDEDNNIFYPQKPFASWILNTTTATWHSPIGDAPDDLTDEEKTAYTHYIWNEAGQSWDKEAPVA